MNLLRRWLGAVGRFSKLLWAVVSDGARTFVGGAGRLSSRLFYELVWKWWFGYGEQPFRVLVVSVLALVTTWLLYWQLGDFVLEGQSVSPTVGKPGWQDALYYSLASFSALGYGSWVLQPTGWAKWVGAVQPFVGIVSAVALSIAIARRITR